MPHGHCRVDQSKIENLSLPRDEKLRKHKVRRICVRERGRSTGRSRVENRKASLKYGRSGNEAAVADCIPFNTKLMQDVKHQEIAGVFACSMHRRRWMGWFMKDAITTTSLPDEYFVLQMDGRMKISSSTFCGRVKGRLAAQRRVSAARHQSARDANRYANRGRYAGHRVALKLGSV